MQVKGNHPTLRAAIQATHSRGGAPAHDQQARGRAWRTTAYACGDESQRSAWAGLRRYVVVESWPVAAPERVSTRYFITSLGATPLAALAAGVRGHWGIENQLHRVRNVHFGQGRTRIRHPQASVTLALLMTLALNLLVSQGIASLTEAQAHFAQQLPQQVTRYRT